MYHVPNKCIFHLLPPNVDLFNTLFNTAVKTSALSENGDVFKFAEEVEKLSEARNEERAAAGGEIMFGGVVPPSATPPGAMDDLSGAAGAAGLCWNATRPSAKPVGAVWVIRSREMAR